MGGITMAWVAVDKDGYEAIYLYKPDRGNECWNPNCVIAFFGLPKGSIKKLIGKDLDWNDEPVELKEE